jgi:hypothetical protein
MSRDPTAVIDAMLKHIPEDKTVLRANLARIRSNACFVPPEGMARIWRDIGIELESYLNNPPKFDWETRVASIIRGESES